MTDSEHLINLTKEYSLFKKETGSFITSLEKKITELQERLLKYENPKNSTNSSVPPSQDPNRLTRSTRKKTDKKLGGQKGHKGSKLNSVANPDEVIFHDVTQCECCNASLPENGEIKSRQIFDIPKIKIKVTEHRIVIKKCTSCGKQNKSEFPEGLVQEAQYGNEIKSLGVYLQNYQMIPYARCVELLFDLTGHRISAGSLANFQVKMYEQLSYFEDEIKRLLLLSQSMHADETGMKVNIVNGWMHVACNKLLSYFGFHLKRGQHAIDDMNIIPLYNGTLVHDRFSSYFKYQCEHSLCNAHILRELLYLQEMKNLKWAEDISNLLTATYHKQKEGAIFTQENYQSILDKWEKLIAPTINSYDKKFKKTKEEKLAFALEKHKHLFLKFIVEEHVPFDNNQAERDLRMIKVKQKISGCFKEQAYAAYFARIRSYISTLKKNDQDILANIQFAMNIKNFFPDLAE